MTARRCATLLSLTLAVATLALPAPALRAETLFDTLVNRLRGTTDDTRFANSNGRIEAQTVDVAGKYAGRLVEVLVHEGDVVEANAVIARIDDRDMQTQLLGAEASVLQAKAAKEQALAAVMQTESTLSLAQTSYDRVVKLNSGQVASDASLEDARNGLHVAQAALATAKAQVSSTDALISAAEAKVAQVRVALDDLIIRAPIRGRVEYRLREPGEVIAAGTPVVTLLDLTDVYMNLYLGADVVGRLARCRGW